MYNFFLIMVVLFTTSFQIHGGDSGSQDEKIQAHKVDKLARLQQEQCDNAMAHCKKICEEFQRQAYDLAANVNSAVNRIENRLNTIETNVETLLHNSNEELYLLEDLKSQVEDSESSNKKFLREFKSAKSFKSRLEALEDSVKNNEIIKQKMEQARTEVCSSSKNFFSHAEVVAIIKRLEK